MAHNPKIDQNFAPSKATLRGFSPGNNSPSD